MSSNKAQLRSQSELQAAAQRDAARAELFNSLQSCAAGHWPPPSKVRARALQAMRNANKHFGGPVDLPEDLAQVALAIREEWSQPPARLVPAAHQFSPPALPESGDSFSGMVPPVAAPESNDTDGILGGSLAPADSHQEKDSE